MTAPVPADPQLPAALPVQRRIAGELGVREGQVSAAVELLDGGATVPFIARYRKEATGALDDAQLRTLEERLRYLRELEERRAAILESVRAQGKLDGELAARIMAADSKARLEDIYLPYKPKRRTRAQIAREAGLEPLADQLLAHPETSPEQAAAEYADAERGVPDAAAALDGARAILVERFAEDADLIGELREQMWSRGRLVSRVREGREEAGAKYAGYFEFAEPFTALPSHRILAMMRGEKEEILDLTMDAGEPPADGLAPPAPSDYATKIARRYDVADQGRPGDRWLGDTVQWAWRTRISVHLGVDLRMRLWQRAEDEAVAVFAANLRDLLLAAPAGTRATMGLDPGFRTGVKVAVVDGTGKAVATDTIYPHELKRGGAGGAGSPRWAESLETLARLAAAHHVELIAIGNGTASRETDRLAADLIKAHPELKLTKVMVSEAGASVYSASAYASRELPGMDVSLRGAVSIARRLQDPAGRAGQDRPQVHRGRAVPARPGRDQAVPLAGRGRRGLRERRRGGREHRIGPVAGPRVGDQRRAGRLGGGPARRGRPVPQPAGAQGRAAAGTEGVRAGGGVPADPGRRRPAGRVERPPGGLSRGPADPPGGRDGHARADRQHVAAALAAAAGVHR